MVLFGHFPSLYTVRRNSLYTVYSSNLISGVAMIPDLFSSLYLTYDDDDDDDDDDSEGFYWSYWEENDGYGSSMDYLQGYSGYCVGGARWDDIFCNLENLHGNSRWDEWELEETILCQRIFGHWLRNLPSIFLFCYLFHLQIRFLCPTFFHSCNNADISHVISAENICWSLSFINGY